MAQPHISASIGSAADRRSSLGGPAKRNTWAAPMMAGLVCAAALFCAAVSAGDPPRQAHAALQVSVVVLPVCWLAGEVVVCNYPNAPAAKVTVSPGVRTVIY